MSKKSKYQKPYNYNLLQSFSFAFQGIAFALSWERNLRIHLIISALVAYFSSRYYRLSRAEIAMLIISMTMVIAFELINTAIEKTIDLESPGYNHLAKIAKDVAAGAVLITAIGTVVVGLVILWDWNTITIMLADVARQFYIWIPIAIIALAVVFIPEKNAKKKGEYNDKSRN